MIQTDYLYTFSDITDGFCKVQVVKHDRPMQTEIFAAINDQSMASLPCCGMPTPLADAVDLALAVYVADRLSTARTRERKRIEIVLPVRHPEILGSNHILRHLQDVLFSYTEDNWFFKFTRRLASGRLAERQSTLLRLRAPDESTEVALWSGGLDALAGLYSRRNGIRAAGSYTLFGTGGSTIVHAIQRRVAEAVRREFPNAFRHPMTLIQVPVQLSDTRGLPKNSSPRARGFVFLLLGAVCASLEGQTSLYVYENGIGAINLPFRSSEIGLDHSRAVHPLLLYKMAELVSQLLGQHFTIHLPFRFVTKTELCAKLVDDGVISPIDQAVSCDRRHHEIPMQCGCCSSCILRRQALAANSVVEPDDRYVVTSRRDPMDELEDSAQLHLRAMLSQVADLERDLQSATPWHDLTNRYPELADIADEIAAHDGLEAESIQKSLIRMYAAYVAEWRTVRHIVGRGLLPNDELWVQ